MIATVAILVSLTAPVAVVVIVFPYVRENRAHRNAVVRPVEMVRADVETVLRQRGWYVVTENSAEDLQLTLW